MRMTGSRPKTAYSPSVNRASRPRRPVKRRNPWVFALGLILPACTAYGGGTDTTIFLSGRLVGPDGDPATRCHAGPEEDGAVSDWRSVDSEFREMFLLPAGPSVHRIVIQCSGYEEHSVDIATAGSRWQVAGAEYRTNQTIPLGVIVLTPA